MPKYLVEGNYVGDGVKGLLAEGGSKRVEAITALTASLGGTLEAVYYAFGDADIYGIVDFPSPEAAVAFSLTANASGAVQLKMTVLLSPQEIDAATELTPEYRPPGA